jgi:DNA (cytosine-5)-methyltransferase 1
MALNAGACNRIDVECKTFIAGTLKGNNGGGGFGSDPSATFITHSLRAEGFGASEDGAGRGAAGQVVFSVGLGSDPLFADDIAQPVTTRNGDPGTIAFDTAQITSRANRSNPQPGDPSHPLAATGHAPAVALNLRGREGGSQMESADTASLRASSGGSSRSYVQQMAVRRLTPIECERLQGFPDGYTKLDGKTADGPRYRALGNSMAVPVLRWILKQIMEDGK